MPSLIELSSAYHDYFWSMPRTSGLILTAPILSSSMLPKIVKLMLIVVMGLFIKPLIQTIPEVGLSVYTIILVSKEVLIGMIIGFVMALVFQSFIIGGHMIAMQSGLGFASFIDPSTNQTMPVYSQIYLFLVSIVFLGLDGHLLMLRLLVETYQFIPVSLLNLEKDWFWQVCQFSTWIFVGGVIIAIPAIIGLLVVNLTFSVITRAAPQMNIFTIGFPITIVLGIFIVYLTVNSIAPHVQTATNNAMSLLTEMLR